MEDGRSYAEVLKETGGAAATGFGLTSHFYLQKNKNALLELAQEIETARNEIFAKFCMGK